MKRRKPTDRDRSAALILVPAVQAEEHRASVLEALCEQTPEFVQALIDSHEAALAITDAKRQGGMKGSRR